MAHKEDKKQVVQFLNENPDIKPQELKKVFPAINADLLTLILIIG